MVIKKEDLGKQIHLLLLGLQDPTALPAGTQSLVVGSVSYTVPDLVKLVETYDELWQKPERLSVEFHAAVQEREQKIPATRDVIGDVKHAIIAALGSRSPNLVKFGIDPKKDRRQLSSEEKAKKAEQARATRDARHTMGKRQKESIVGTVPAAPSPAPEAPKAAEEKKPTA